MVGARHASAMAIIDHGLEILPEEECRALLGQAALGRVAITLGALPAVLPVNFAVQDGDILFLTGEGTKLRAALHRAVVAFEVDDFDPARRSGWSVLAVGVAEEVTDEEELARAGQLRLAPWAGGDRTRWIRIRPEFLSGRRIVASSEAGNTTTAA